MMAFAANSVLARLALAGGGLEPLGYTGIRLASGAIVLFALVRLADRQAGHRPIRLGGTWWQAGALFGYAAAFSAAYVKLGASTGALILFGSVQLGMLTRAIVTGDRPGPLEWLGFLLAFGALIYLVSPGLAAPDPLGAALMIAAGLFWAAYSLMGRGSTSPLVDTAGNFMRCLPIAAVLTAVGLVTHSASSAAIAYAIASGALASGIGYAVWYAALPLLSRSRAALVQLSVPVIAAVGAVLFISEPVSLRLVIASLAVLGGIAIAIVASEHRKSRAATL